MTALLLAATPLAPLLLLAALAYPASRARALGLLWMAPLPGFACALFAAGAEPLVFHRELRLSLALDAPAALLLGAAALLWCGASAYARTAMPRQDALRFAVWWLPTMAGSLGVFVAADLVSFYLVYALASLPAWGLVIHDRTSRAWSAGSTYILLTVIGEAALLAAFALLAAGAPGTSLAIADMLPPLADAPLRDVVIALLLLGFGLKAGLVPLHVWLPLAHPAAPTAASAVLSGAIIKAGIIGLLRFLPIEATPTEWGIAIAAIGFLTAFWGVVFGITQRNPKTILAYSSVSQMGVVAAVIGMGVVGGIAATPAAAAYYALHHVLAKGALFLATGIADKCGGPARWLVLGPTIILALGFGGMPLTGGWLAKEAVKAQLGSGVAGTFAALSAAGSTLLMLQFTRRLATTVAEDAAARPPLPPLIPWLGLATAAVALPWLLFATAGGHYASALSADSLLKALWPVLAGLMLLAVLARWGARLPEAPEGDIIVAARRALSCATPIDPMLTRAEVALRAWPIAGLALIGVTIALGLVMVVW